MAKRSKKRAAMRASGANSERIATANYVAENLRRMDPEKYFREKTNAFDAVMKTQVANDVVQRAYAQGRDAGGKTVTENLGTCYTAAMCCALNEMYGFGKKRLCDLMERMNTIMLNTFTSADAINRVYKQLGLRFSEDDPFNWLSIDDEGGNA